MITVGITGGIGSGKTTVAKFFEAYQIPTYLADDEAKKLMLQNPIKADLLDLFGPKTYFPDGSLNRKFLADQVFDNKPLLDKLNAIVHPRVADHYKEWVAQQKSPYILYEAAILFETGRYKDFDYIILVTAPKEERIKRLKLRDKSSEKEIRARMDNQWQDEKKEKMADFIIRNEDFSITKEKVSQIHTFISNL